MPSATARVLTCLEVLQDRPSVTGAELAARLEVHPRTVRRYVAALQELGIPVEGERGLGGGYRLRPGYRVPPLMLDDDEAAGAVLALVAARRLGLDPPGDAAGRALAKLRRVLPDRLRSRVEALEQVVAFTGPPAATGAAPPATATVLALAGAIGARRRVACAYVAHDGTPSRRELSPFGLVVHAGRWYLVAHDHDRDALRTFRVDRLDRVTPGTGADAPPPGLDPAAHVEHALAEVPWAWAVEVTVALPHADAARRLPPVLATLEPRGEGHTLVRMRVERLGFAAALLAGLDRPFAVHRPPELRACVRELAARLAASADA